MSAEVSIFHHLFVKNVNIADVALMVHTNVCTLYLRGEVSVEYALAMQVLQSSGNIQRQTDPDAPRQVQVTVQQLLQVPSIYILQREEENRITIHLQIFSAYEPKPTSQNMDVCSKVHTQTFMCVI